MERQIRGSYREVTRDLFQSSRILLDIPGSTRPGIGRRSLSKGWETDRETRGRSGSRIYTVKTLYSTCLPTLFGVRNYVGVGKDKRGKMDGPRNGGTEELLVDESKVLDKICDEGSTPRNTVTRGWGSLFNEGDESRCSEIWKVIVSVT